MQSSDFLVVRLEHSQRDFVFFGVVVRVDSVFRRQHIVWVEILVDVLGDDQHFPPPLGSKRVLAYFFALEVLFDWGSDRP